MRSTEEYMDTDELVDYVCSECGIPSFRLGMTDEEIARVCRWIGMCAPGSKIVDGKPAISTEGFDTMIFVTIVEFPKFCEKHKLLMVWRN